MTTPRPTSPFEHGTPRAGYRDITPAQALAANGACRLVDVREPDEWSGELGRLAGAELVPLAQVEQQAQAWPRDADVILVCRSGGRSGRAAETLVRAGFTRVMNLVGGMLAVAAAGLPVQR